MQEVAPQRADVLLVTVTDVETKAILDEFGTQLQQTPIRHFVDTNAYVYLGSVRGAQIFLVRSEMGSGGASGSMLTISDSIQALNPSAIILVGIAFGVDPTKQQIGEILVAKQLLDYELQRVGNDTNGAAVIRMRGDRPSASPRLLSRFHT